MTQPQSIVEAQPGQLVTIGGKHIKLVDLAEACGILHTQAICVGTTQAGLNNAIRRLARLLGTGCATQSH